MSVQNEPAATRPIGSERRRSLAHSPRHSCAGHCAGWKCGQLIVDSPAGERLVFEGARPGAQARLTINDWRCLWRLVTGSDVGFAEGYAVW